MSVLLDTNILLRSAQTAHPMQQLAIDSAAALRDGGDPLCLVLQNLYEFWAVSTRPVTANGLGLSIAEAEAEISRLKSLVKICDDIPAILAVWEKLIVSYQITGKNAHDARLAAAMIVHGIKRILTFNTADFQRYKEIEAVAPNDVVKLHS